MVGANSLFAPRKIMQGLKFDERFQRNYEDIDFSYRMQLSGYPVIVLNKVEIYHMEDTKDYLQQRFL